MPGFSIRNINSSNMLLAVLSLLSLGDRNVLAFAATTPQQLQFQVAPLSIPFTRVDRSAPPLGSVKAAGSAAAGLDNKEDIQYVAQVKIGSKTFQINLDTGSSDTWVRGPNCKNELNDGSCDGPALDPAQESLLEPLPDGMNDFVFSYGLGNCSGKLYNAPISMAGKTVTIPIGVADSANHMSGNDGLMGLAFDSISQISKKTKKSASFFDALAFPSSQKMFGFYLSHNSDERDQGVVTLGGYDSSKFTGDIMWFPLTKSSYWQIDVKGSTVQVGNSATPIPMIPSSSSLSLAIADTGTTQIILPDSVAKSINDALGTISCSMVKTGPPVLLKIGSNTLTVPPSSYIRTGDDGKCASGFSGGADRLGFIILGAVFNRAYYTIYDKSTPTPRVGFAQAVHPGDGTVPNSSNSGGGSVPSSPPTNSNGNTISSASSTPSSGKLSSSQIVVIIMVVTFTICMGIIFIGVYQRLKSESRLHLLHPSTLFPFLYTSSSKKPTSTADTPTGKEGKFSLFKTATSFSTTAATTSKAAKFPSVPKITLSRSKSAESSKSLHNSTSQATLIDLPKLEEGFLTDFSDFLTESGVGDRSSANAAAAAATSSSATARTGFTRLFQRRNSRVQPASSKGFSFFSSKK